VRKPVVLITGANGEIGHGLIERLAGDGTRAIAPLDVAPLDVALSRRVAREITGSILDVAVLERILSEFEVDLIFHLAAVLSTRAEFSPMTAHRVNVEGTLNLLEFAYHQAESHGRPVAFLYPSSIAVYGLPSSDEKRRAGAVREDDYCRPTTMSGCNKLYCEQLGRYYARHYKQLSAESLAGRVDFRAIRFPGLIYATTVPSGGTSAYAAEMIHAAAQHHTYACFVRPDAQIPFMAMPDGIEALLALARVPRERLTRTAYNVRGFAPAADDIRREALRAFPQARIEYVVDEKRQAIIDAWPADVDDTAARTDWNFQPAYDFTRAFRDYLIPTVTRR
jgi:nucleoside-diphosphate-sugar epimerase